MFQAGSARGGHLVVAHRGRVPRLAHLAHHRRRNLVGLSLLWSVLSAGRRTSQVFLLDPECAAARLRAGEIGEPPGSFTSRIHVALERLRQLAAQPGVRLSVYVYDTRPVWRVIGLDDTLYVSGFASWEGHSSTMCKLLPTTGGALYNGFRRMLGDLAATSTQIV